MEYSTSKDYVRKHNRELGRTAQCNLNISKLAIKKENSENSQKKKVTFSQRRKNVNASTSLMMLAVVESNLRSSRQHDLL